MKHFQGFVFISFFILMVGCTQEKSWESSLIIEAVILEVKDGRMLVAENVTSSEYAEISDKTIQELDEERISLIYLSYDKLADVKAGDEVEIWIDGGLDHSYPAQGHAKKVELKEE
ncbi:DUF3221 domain-containing protein [Sutcliffiella horikoshii]|uniref:DUF3221 domain-containing protein n=1 Tax=Sutcliffiella horikoshii TaxID=79883 RepID=A0AA94WRK5_9BACI|nr:DUF3221 domain-containing protein [Sutcliffiella horikoshii]TYS58492.1 DUF3221 domain-containing protein [Sutcliffiella horikoshii]